jgi:hypothetical protein
MHTVTADHVPGPLNRAGCGLATTRSQLMRIVGSLRRDGHRHSVIVLRYRGDRGAPADLGAELDGASQH